MKTENLNTGKYAGKISKKASNIEAKAKPRKIRRLIFLGSILLVCLGGVFMGISGRSKSIETQYQEYIEAPNQSALNNELLSYHDVSIQFEISFLGNRACQSLMGGFFYDGPDYSIYPDETAKKMIICSGDREKTLCNGLASDINVKDGLIFYRKINSRVISLFSITSGKTAEMPMKNVGQFIVCGEKLFYIDLTSSSLLVFDLVTYDTYEIIDSGVSAFVVIGNNIIYLDNVHTLYELDLSDGSRTTIGENISDFSYNGKLWMQNNEKVYCKSLDKNAIKDYAFNVQCNRLLGITDTLIFIESEDGIYACDIETNTSHRIAANTFIGGSDEWVLLYDLSNGSYQIDSVN